MSLRRHRPPQLLSVQAVSVRRQCGWLACAAALAERPVLVSSLCLLDSSSSRSVPERLPRPLPTNDHGLGVSRRVPDVDSLKSPSHWLPRLLSRLPKWLDRLLLPVTFPGLCLSSHMPRVFSSCRRPGGSGFGPAQTPSCVSLDRLDRTASISASVAVVPRTHCHTVPSSERVSLVLRFAMTASRPGV